MRIYTKCTNAYINACIFIDMKRESPFPERFFSSTCYLTKSTEHRLPNYFYL